MTRPVRASIEARSLADTQAIQAEGRIKLQLHDPHGGLNGVLLEDGTEIHLSSTAAERLSADLAPGRSVYAEGTGYAGPLGKSILAREIGATKDSAIILDATAPPVPANPGKRSPKQGEPTGPEE
jgi:hypothetical protein